MILAAFFWFAADPYKGWLHEDRVLLGAVKRSYTCLTFSPDGNWLYAGTRSGDVVTVNVVRKNVQVGATDALQRCSSTNRVSLLHV